jgi:TolB-like protein
MKKASAPFLLFISLFFTSIVTAQEKYEKEINEITTKLNTELNSIIGNHVSAGTKARVAIISFENEDGKTTKLTELLSDEIAVELVLQSKGAYTLLDRNNIQRIIKEKNIPNDFGDKADFARQLGRFKAADLVIVGKVINFENNYRILFTVIETKEGNTVSGARGMLTKTDLLKSKNEEKLNVDTKISNSEKGDVRSEVKNQTKPVETNGWIEFENRTPGNIIVFVSQNSQITTNPNITDKEQITLSPKSNDKLVSLKSGVYYICAYFDNGGNGMSWGTPSCLFTKKVEVEADKGTKPVIFQW